MKNFNQLIKEIIFPIIIVFLINLIFYYGFIRFDFTSNKIYSLSKASKKIISKFDDKILIRAIFSKTLPENVKFIKLYVEDLLKEYKIYSKGKIKYEFIDPQAKNPKMSESEVRNLGIHPVEFTVLQKDKFEIKKGYMGLAMLYKDQKDIIPIVDNVESLEYQITSTLKKLTLKEKKVVGVLTNAQADTLETEEFDYVKQQLSKFYEFEIIDISSANLSKIDGLLVIAPKINFKDEEFFLLDQYILSGKPVVFLLSRYDVDLNTFFARKIYSNIFEFIKNYGIEIKEGLIIDPQCQKIGLTIKQGFLIMQSILDYPFIPSISDLNKNHPLVKDLSQVSLPFVAPISIEKKLENVDYNILFRTSKQSFFKKEIYYIHPSYADFSYSKNLEKGPFIVGLEIKGQFKSFFNEEKLKNIKKNNFILKTDPQVKESRIIIISTGEFVDKEQVLLSNIIDYLVQDLDLLSIRSKKIALSPIKEVNDKIKLGYIYFITLFPPILIVMFGLYRWYRRKNKFISL